MVNILMVRQSGPDRAALERSILKTYPGAMICYADDTAWISASFQKYLIDIVIIPALAWDRSLFELPQGRPLPRLVVTTTEGMGGTEGLDAFGLPVLRRPFTDWRVFAAINQALSNRAPRPDNWDFLLFRYNYRFVVLPFAEITAIEFESPYLTIRSKSAVFVLAKDLCEILAKIPDDGRFQFLVGRPQTGPGQQ